MRQGKIILVPFPFSDLSASKIRPALILSNNTLPGKEIVIIGISSKKHFSTDIEINNENLSYGELPKTSFVRSGKLVSIDKSIIISTIGKINENIMKQIIEINTKFLLSEKV